VTEQVEQRPIIVVDVESTGLDIVRDIPVEVAWWNLATGQRGEFIPHHDIQWVLDNADPYAISAKCNGYRERIMRDEQDVLGRGAAELFMQFDGRAYLAGANAATLDQWMIAKLWPGAQNPRPWHYRIYDVANLADQEFDLGYLPGLHDVCTMLGLEDLPNHGATDDVTATGRALLALFELRAKRRADDARRALGT
jgi:oligoribonuclease (3'-5' exoribonuclease)